jgi:L-serine dehydratase
MQTSLFDLFKIGIGPSSSHTVGPMRAACSFARRLSDRELLEHVAQLRVELFGSLAFTGLGHGTDRGIVLGLMGNQPDEVDPDEIESCVAAIRRSRQLLLSGRRTVPFLPDDLIFNKETLLPGHSNGMRFTALDVHGQIVDTRVYYSVGGGFITEEGEGSPPPAKPQALSLPHRHGTPGGR